MAEVSIPTNPNKKTDRMSLKKFFTILKKQKYLQIMVIPGIIWMLVFNYIPMGGIIIAFKDYDLTTSMFAAPWVGLKHFAEFLTDDTLGPAIINTIGISFIKLIIGFPIPIIFAILLNEIRFVKFKKAVQTISYLPHFLSWVILGGMLINWLSETGLINQVLMNFHIISNPITFLAEPDYFWGVSVISDIWKELGWSAIIYLAAIAGIDPELYEAATVDGAGRFRKMWNITFPCISGTVAILFILAVGGLLNSNFDQILVLQNSLNQSKSEVLDTFVYHIGIQQMRYSYSTAVGLVKSLIALVLLIIANTVTDKLNGSALF